MVHGLSAACGCGCIKRNLRLDEKVTVAGTIVGLPRTAAHVPPSVVQCPRFTASNGSDPILRSVRGRERGNPIELGRWPQVMEGLRRRA